jgi:arylsulfatase A-like enzyme/Tfp pilus assembly protein PilF
VLLITLDTVRADRMGFLGSPRRLTPNLDALAAKSTVFTRAYAQVPLTNPSHATILTGTYPQLNFVDDFGVPLAPGLPYLPEVLQEQGYRTGAFVASHVLGTADAPGFDRGFDAYDSGAEDRRPAAAVVERATAWLREQPAGPFFLWVHFYDAHAPYEPPEPYRSRHAAEPYDGCIEYADAQVGELVARLTAMGRLKETLVVVTADHGEAFGEHGERQHGYLLYDETIHVPLLVRAAGEVSAARRVETRVGLVDVAPTVLQAVGLAAPPAMQGEALLAPALQRTKAPQRAIYSETDYPFLAFGWSPLRAWRAERYLFVQAPRRELYDLAADPQALHNLAAESPAVADTLEASLVAFRRATASAGAAPQAVVDAQRAHRLNALGYVASSRAEAGAPSAPTGTDPKDRIEVANRMMEALLAMNAGRYAEALPLLQLALEQEPNSVVVHRVIGEDFIWLGNHKAALPHLRKALELGSDVAMTHYQLGLALFGVEDWSAAASAFEAAVARSPSWAEAHYSLGAAYGRLERPADARRELEAAIAIEPRHFYGNLDLGELLLRQHEAAAALARLTIAAEVQPQSSEAHRLLGLAYSGLGRSAEARREEAAAERLRR